MFRIVLDLLPSGTLVTVDSSDRDEPFTDEQIQVRHQPVSVNDLAKCELRGTVVVWRCAVPSGYLSIRDQFERDRNY